MMSRSDYLHNQSSLINRSRYSYTSTKRYVSPSAPHCYIPSPRYSPLRLLPSSTCPIEPVAKYPPITAYRSKKSGYSQHKDRDEDTKLAGKLGCLSLKGRRKCLEFGKQCPPTGIDFHKDCTLIILLIHHPCGDPMKPKAAIVDVDLCIPRNVVAHHTDMYEVCWENYTDDITKKCCAAQLVIRRGQAFKVTAHLNRDYDKGVLIRLVSTMGKVPLRSKGTHNEMVTGEDADKGDWSVKIISAKKNVVELAVLSPPNCAVGKWNLAFEAIETNEKGAIIKLMKESVDRHCYILFNAWCKDDMVYMDNEDCRNEYVLNDSGKLYVGTYNCMFGRPWNFGQFDSVSLEAAMYILNELTCISVTARGSPIAISRKLSALVNCQDEYGILAGKWEGPYCGGTNPVNWTGSVDILLKYMCNRSPVEYGQCWVYSGLMTTLCRTLGIPTRSVTNYMSAHDEDGSLTFDMHWDEEGKPMTNLNEQIWNFHVWNECWMIRPDLDNSDMGGWQVVDATPQEQSDGVYCAGPAPVAAIKSGYVGVPFDTPFIFAEVNADIVHWTRWNNGCIKTRVEKDVVGKNISTKAVGPSRDFTCGDPNPDREDITHQYKYPEGSHCERVAVWRAMKTSSKPHCHPIIPDPPEDVTFAVDDIQNIVIGSDFEISIRIQNTCWQDRTFRLAVTLYTMYYTGVIKHTVRHEVFNDELSPNSTTTILIPIAAEEYEQCAVDGNHMQISYFGHVIETDQWFASRDCFRLRSVIPQMQSNKCHVCVGETFTVKLQFNNPLRKWLTGCKFTFEAAGNLKPTDSSEVGPGDLVEAECDITARRPGECVAIAAFECDQFGDVQAQCTVMVGR